MRLHLLRIFLLLIVFCFCYFDALASQFDHGQWNALLQKHVQMVSGGYASQVDYVGMQRDQVQLKSYLQEAAKVGREEFDAWSVSEQLAFLINIYNSATIELILTRYPNLASIKDLGSFFRSPWKKDFISLFGSTVSLDNIEQDMIRGSDRYLEPRIHFALNCASIGCPALQSTAYTGSDLEKQLDHAVRLFLQDRTRNRFEQDHLAVSPIFKWYREDFCKGWRGCSSLGDFLTYYGEDLGLNAGQKQALRQGRIGIEFLDYDWRLNSVDETPGAEITRQLRN